VSDDTAELAGIAERAYVWGFALVVAARIRQNLTLPLDPTAPRPASVAGAPINNLGHQRALADPELRVGVGPNVDTLYSLAWLDLADEPFVFETPDFADRYYTFQIAYADSSSDAALGRRTHGSQLPPLFIHGPAYHGAVPEAMIAISSPTRYFMLGGRVLVQPGDPDDLERVHALQRAMRLRTWPRFRHGDADDGDNPIPDQRLLVAPDSAVPDELRFLEELGNVVRDWTVTDADRAVLAELPRIGVTAEHGFEPGTLEPHQAAAVAAGLARGADKVLARSHALGETVNGWTLNRNGPQFGDDHLLRSGVAKDQIYVVVPEEALYPVTAVDGTGQPLHGHHRYRLRFAPGELPPVDAFWSVTIYHDHGGLVPNPIARYAIGDRTPGLRPDADGALTIVIQHDTPDDPNANWLPAPAEGFHVELRLYVPQPAALDGRWQPPPIKRLAAP
jgi:hypothetical protein